MILLITQILLIALNLGFYNAYIILWGTHKGNRDYDTRRKKWSKIWHVLGWIVRFQLAILMAYSIWIVYSIRVVYEIDYILMLKWGLFYISIAAILYDVIINIVRYIEDKYPPILYIDNKGINKIILDIISIPLRWIYKDKIIYIAGVSIAIYWILRLLFFIGSIIYLII